MTSGLKTIVYPVRDVNGAKALYGRILGTAPIPGRGPRRRSASQRPQPGHDRADRYWHVEDIKATLESLVEGGAEPVQAISDIDGGKLVASVKGADGKVIGLIQES